MRRFFALLFVFGGSVALSACLDMGPACENILRIEFNPPLTGPGNHEIVVTTGEGGSSTCHIDMEARSSTCDETTFVQPYITNEKLEDLELRFAPTELRVVVRLDGNVQRDKSFSPDYSITPDSERECRWATISL
jgi:hypothetical protein